MAQTIFGKCKPPACIDIHVKVLDVKLHVTEMHAVGTQGSCAPWEDHKAAIETDLVDKLKTKFDVGGNVHDLNKGCDDCKYVDLFSTDKDHAKEFPFEAKPITIYVDKDGKVIKGAEGAACKIIIGVTVKLQVYGTVGMCVEDDTA